MLTFGRKSYHDSRTQAPAGSRGATARKLRGGAQNGGGGLWVDGKGAVHCRRNRKRGLPINPPSRAHPKFTAVYRLHSRTGAATITLSRHSSLLYHLLGGRQRNTPREERPRKNKTELKDDGPPNTRAKHKCEKKNTVCTTRWTAKHPSRRKYGNNNPVQRDEGPR